VRKSATLPTESLEMLTRQAEAFLGETGPAPDTRVRDGAPFDLVVVSPDAERRMDGNLAGVTDEHAGLDLARAMLTLSSRILERTSLTRSVDGLGNIVISEV
jgi:hypothetical protein